VRWGVSWNKCVSGESSVDGQKMISQRRERSLTLGFVSEFEDIDDTATFHGKRGDALIELIVVEQRREFERRRADDREEEGEQVGMNNKYNTFNLKFRCRTRSSLLSSELEIII
jgi:hypothetical protein